MTRHVTQEGNAASISQFVKQRTRWSQGFLNSASKKASWKKLPTFSASWRSILFKTTFLPGCYRDLLPISLYMMFFSHTDRFRPCCW